jgi:methionyl-tRNA formyltransferase
MTTAIVFAYHDVGVRCLKVLLAQGVHVPLVVTHRDNAGENIWFDSVAAVAREYDIPAITPDDPNLPATVETVVGLNPDFLFSFYFRQMIGPQQPDHAAR